MSRQHPETSRWAIREVVGAGVLGFPGQDLIRETRQQGYEQQGNRRVMKQVDVSRPPRGGGACYTNMEKDHKTVGS
jgi:hypothetical protein